MEILSGRLALVDGLPAIFRRSKFHSTPRTLAKSVRTSGSRALLTQTRRGAEEHSGLRGAGGLSVKADPETWLIEDTAGQLSPKPEALKDR